MSGHSPGPTTPQTGTGSPVGHVTPRFLGDLYVDTSGLNLWFATGTTSSGWTETGVQLTPQSGSGAPTGVATPRFVGDLYVDTTGLLLWFATGLTNASWSKSAPTVIPVQQVKLTGGDITTASTTYILLQDNGGNPALIPGIAAVAGDILEIGISLTYKNSTQNSVGAYTAFTMNGASSINNIAGGATAQVSGWRRPGPDAGSTSSGISGSILYTVQAADVIAGKVNLQFFWLVGANTGTTACNATTPFVGFVKNLGH